MGGRGASIGTKYYYDGKKWRMYGDEYQSVHTAGNIKFLVNKDSNNTKAPMETRTKGRVYVTLNKKDGKPQYVTYYDKKNKKFKQIDVHKNHRHIDPELGDLGKEHTHKGYLHSENGSRKLTAKERKLVAKIKQEWRKNVRNKFR